MMLQKPDIQYTYCQDYHFSKIAFWPDCKQFWLMHGLMMSVCPFVVHILLTFAFKFWNLLCNSALPSSCSDICLVHLQKPDTRYTYCQDYHHSMTVVPVNVEALKKQEAAEHRARFKTEKGWIFPGMKSMLECNVHPRRPITARVEELQEVGNSRYVIKLQLVIVILIG